MRILFDTAGTALQDPSDCSPPEQLVPKQLHCAAALEAVAPGAETDTDRVSPGRVVRFSLPRDLSHAHLHPRTTQQKLWG